MSARWVKHLPGFLQSLQFVVVIIGHRRSTSKVVWWVVPTSSTFDIVRVVRCSTSTVVETTWLIGYAGNDGVVESFALVAVVAVEIVVICLRVIHGDRKWSFGKSRGRGAFVCSGICWQSLEP